MASGPITSWQIDGETVETVANFIFWDSKITADGDCSHEIKRRLLLGRKIMTILDSILKRWDITLPTKVHLVKAMAFPVIIYWCESWTKRKLSTEELMLLNCGVGEDSWESLGLQGDQPVNPKGNQSWIFIGRTDVEAETPILWPPDAHLAARGKSHGFSPVAAGTWGIFSSYGGMILQSSCLFSDVRTPVSLRGTPQNWLIRKDPDAGKDWRQEEKGTTEDEMVGWHHWLNGHEFE